MLTTIYKPPPIVLEKLNHLLDILQKARKDFEEMASTIKNKEIRQTILGLVQESRQYANELVSHIQMLGGETTHPHFSIEFNYDGIPEKKDWKIFQEERDSIQYCTMTEKSIVKLYREVLNEPFLYEDIRKMIRYQLNGMMHSFSQLKLLSASLHKNKK
jgi:hypothetical protein